MNFEEILICSGTGCLSSGAEEIENELKKILKKENLVENYSIKKVVKKTGCMGPCSLGPVIIIMPEKTFYGQLQIEDIEKIVQKHLIRGEIVKSLLLKDENHQDIEKYTELDFYNNQKRIALRNTGLINPSQIKDYQERDGYKALKKAVTMLSPEDVLEMVKGSELRGRGGAGFPTGIKWEFTKKAEGNQKYIICNGDEGDPGAFMDRSILEGDPHSIIEAMAIAGYTVGADQGYVYVRAEYPLAIENLQKALEDAEEYGYLNDNIFGTDFSFDIEIRKGAGAFVCGEETALIASIEGERGEPTSRPPYPASSGLWGNPTLINNVETFANIPSIILKGKDWFTDIGTENSRGTKVFAIAGDVKRTGLIEVPMGTTLREIIYDIAGGISEDKKFKAAQIGGPSGGTVPAKYLDLEIDYETVKKADTIVGSGGLIIMNEDNCMVDVARFFLDFTQDESCGKCTSCRLGTRRMLDILERITNNEGQVGDIEKLKKLGNTIKETSLCGLGQTAPNPVLSTITYFQDEYKAHIQDNRCPARQCKEFMDGYIIDSEICTGCSLCKDNCPKAAINSHNKVFTIDSEKCSLCGKCLQVCPVGAIS